MIFPRSKREAASRNLRQQLGHLKAETGFTSLQHVAKQIGGIGVNRLYKLQEQPEIMTYGEQYMLAVYFRKNGLTFDPTLGGVL